MATTIQTSEHIEVETIRQDFPILGNSMRNGVPLAFLDSAASSQKPQTVIDAISDYYSTTNANIHRGVYDLSERATTAYESVRKQTAAFINAASAREIVFVRNTTEAINMVARSWGEANLRQGDLIAFSAMEHHSNIVPWHHLAEQTGARTTHIAVTSDGRLDLNHLDSVLAQGPKLVAITHVSNALGTINPIREIARKVHAAGALLLVDGAQSVPHMSINVQDLDCDFFAFSGHKMLAPMGVGVLYAKRALLNAMPPFLGGGSMIRKVSLERTTYADAPAKFEAGTPAVDAVIGLGAALTYLQAIGMDRIQQHEQELTSYMLQQLREVPGLQVVGPDSVENHSAVVSFVMDGVHPHDVAALLNEDNVAVRAGHHCAQPVLEQLGVHATSRASAYLYNTHADIDQLVASLRSAYSVFHLD